MARRLRSRRKTSANVGAGACTPSESGTVTLVSVEKAEAAPSGAATVALSALRQTRRDLRDVRMLGVPSGQVVNRHAGSLRLSLQGRAARKHV